MMTSAKQLVRRTSPFLLFLLFLATFNRSTMAEASSDPSNTASLVQQHPETVAAPASTQLTAETLADLMVVHHSYLDAIAAYQKIAPQTAQICNKTGNAYQHMFMDKEAKASFEHALKLDPHSAEAYNNLGTIYYGGKDYGKAEHLYKKSIKLNPKIAVTYSNLGTLYFSIHQIRQGTVAYKRAFLLNPNVFQESLGEGIQEPGSSQQLAHLNYFLAKTYAQAGMNGRALQYLRQALNEGLENPKDLRQDKDFATLRGTPEFQQLMTDESKH